MEQADCPLNVRLILSDPLVSKDNKGKSTMTTPNHRISQKTTQCPKEKGQTYCF
jgi:hypothetical protein